MLNRLCYAAVILTVGISATWFTAESLGARIPHSLNIAALISVGALVLALVMGGLARVALREADRRLRTRIDDLEATIRQLAAQVQADGEAQARGIMRQYVDVVCDQLRITRTQVMAAMESDRERWGAFATTLADQVTTLKASIEEYGDTRATDAVLQDRRAATSISSPPAAVVPMAASGAGRQRSGKALNGSAPEPRRG